MNCVLCDRKISDDINFACDRGWIPNFWCNDQEYGPVCPHCTENYLQLGDDKEFEIRPVFVQTFLDSASSNMPLAEKSVEPDLELIQDLKDKYIDNPKSLTKEELIVLISHFGNGMMIFKEK